MHVEPVHLPTPGDDDQLTVGQGWPDHGVPPTPAGRCRYCRTHVLLTSPSPGGRDGERPRIPAPRRATMEDSGRFELMDVPSPAPSMAIVELIEQMAEPSGARRPRAQGSRWIRQRRAGSGDQALHVPATVSFPCRARRGSTRRPSCSWNAATAASTVGKKCAGSMVRVSSYRSILPRTGSFISAKTRWMPAR